MRRGKDKEVRATLELPKYIPKEELLGKDVFDSEIEKVGRVRDWDYEPDGVIHLVVDRDEGNPPKRKRPNAREVLIPFANVDRVGSFILLDAPLGSLIQEEDEGEEEAREEGSEPKSFDEIDGEQFDRKMKRIVTEQP